MKKLIIIGLFICWSSVRVCPQEFEIEQLLLNVEKLAQFKQILQDMKDGYEILAQGYGFISVFTILEKQKANNLVLDLRGNRGGFTAYAKFLFSYFIDQTYPYIQSIEVQKKTIIPFLH